MNSRNERESKLYQDDSKASSYAPKGQIKKKNSIMKNLSSQVSVQDKSFESKKDQLNSSTKEKNFAKYGRFDSSFHSINLEVLKGHKYK